MFLCAKTLETGPSNLLLFIYAQSLIGKALHCAIHYTNMKLLSMS